MANLYIMCGLAFSGKSTLSKKIALEKGFKCVAFDEMWQKVDKKSWKLVRKACLSEVSELLKSGLSVIYDDNNPRFEHREEFRKVAQKLRAKVTVIYLNTPIEIIREREIKNRITKDRHEVDPINFNKVASDLEIPNQNEKFVEFTPNTNLEYFLQTI